MKRLTELERKMLRDAAEFVLAGEWPWEPEKDSEHNALQNASNKLVESFLETKSATPDMSDRLSDSPLTDALDDRLAPDSNGTDDWKTAYMGMLIQARHLENRNRILEKAPSELANVGAPVAASIAQAHVARGLTAEEIEGHYPTSQHQPDECEMCRAIHDIAKEAITPTPAAPPNKGVAREWLCQAWGESDRKLACICGTRAEVEQFFIREWMGDKDCDELPPAMKEFDEHDWDDDPKLYWEFEIGGVSVTRIFESIAATGERGEGKS